MNVLTDFIRGKCSGSGVLTLADFGNDVVRYLEELSLFEAIQAVHFFFAYVNHLVVDKTVFLVGITSLTRRWWSNIAHVYSSLDGDEFSKQRLSLETNPAFSVIFKMPLKVSHALVQMCTEGKLCPSMFTPPVVSAFASVSVENCKNAVEAFRQFETSYSSYFAKQELLLSFINNTARPVAPNGSAKVERISNAIAHIYNNSSVSESVFLFSPQSENVDLTLIDTTGRTVMESNDDRQIPGNKQSKTKSWAELANNGKVENSHGNDNNMHSQQQRVNKQYNYGNKTDSGNTPNEAIPSKRAPNATTPSTLLLSDDEARSQLPGLLNSYIMSKCVANDHCRKSDFDGTARDALQRISFLQALQAIEHFATSVSARIQKRPAYLMGILRGQETHWDKSRAAAQIEGGSAKLLALPPQVLLQIAYNCLEGNCLPSDFTPEVCLAMHVLNTELQLKALQAFNCNKRIVAGCRGGILNRPRFFERLVQNVAEQNPASNTRNENHSSSNRHKQDDIHRNERERENSFASTLSAGDIGDTHKHQQHTHQSKVVGKGSSRLLDHSKRMPGRSISIPPLDTDDDSLRTQNFDMSPLYNAWKSPLATSPSMRGTWGGGSPHATNGRTGDGQGIQSSHHRLGSPTGPIRSVSLDESSSSAFTWGTAANPQNISLSPRGGEANELKDGATSNQTRVMDSNSQALELGWTSPTVGRDMQSLQVPGSIGHRSWPQGQNETIQPHQFRMTASNVPRNISSGEDFKSANSMKPWSRNEYQVEQSDLNVSAKPFSMFVPNGQESRANSSVSPGKNESQNTQPQDEEPELNTTLDIQSKLTKLSVMTPDQKAEYLEQEVLKLSSDLKKVLNSERRAHAETRRLQIENSKLKSQYTDTLLRLRQQLLMTTSKTFDAYLVPSGTSERRAVSSPTNSGSAQHIQKQHFHS